MRGWGEGIIDNRLAPQSAALVICGIRASPESSIRSIDVGLGCPDPRGGSFRGALFGNSRCRFGTAYVLADEKGRVGGDLIDVYQFNYGSARFRSPHSARE